MSSGSDKNRKNFTEWLDLLQQESWQLELIISSILLLILGSYDEWVYEFVNKYSMDKGSFMPIFAGLIIPVLLFIKTNLIIHIFFRGLWIGCIGLRYVSKEIDFEYLSYSDKFTNYLKNNISDFDTYIEKLERISSIIFSYSFLMVFHFLSFWLFFLILVLFPSISKMIDNVFLDKILKFISIILALAGLLNFIDFLTLGFLKRYKWIAFVFYPFYRLYNFFSLSFLYRPLHYNFIDNPLGRKYMFCMIPYIAFLMIFSSGMNIGSFNYIPAKKDNSNWAIEHYYDNLRKDEAIKIASIDKLVYRDEAIRLFIRYKDTEATENSLKQLCPNIIPYDRSKYQMNAARDFQDGMDSAVEERRSTTKSQKPTAPSITCITKMFEISIDSLSFTTDDFLFYEHPNMGEQGIMTVIDIDDLPSGKHNLALKIKSDYKDSAFKIRTIEIPFFKKGVALN